MLLAALLVDLLEDVAELGLAIAGGPQLRVAIELDEEIALLDQGARSREPDDDQRLGPPPGAGRSGEARRRDGVAADRFDEPVQPKVRDDGAACPMTLSPRGVIEKITRDRSADGGGRIDPCQLDIHATSDGCDL